MNTTGFEKSLDSMLKRLSTKMEKAGGDLGKDFERGLNKTNFDAAFDKMAASADRASTRASGSLSKVTNEARHTTDAVGDLGTELEGVATSARKVKLGGIGGGRGGTGFRQAGDDAGWFSNKLSELSSQGVGVRRAISGLHDTVAFFGTAVSAAVGGLSSAAQGIFAVGANAASAAPAVAVLANGLIGLAQVGGTIGISMQGVGNALTAGLTSVQKSATAATGSVGGLGNATAAAARGVRDAKQALSNAYRDAGRAAADASRRVVDAEHALAAAQQDSEVAQKALNAAREEGKQQMEDIAFAAEDASLAEQRAKLDLSDAAAALQAVSGLAPDDRARVDAELAFKEADLAAREAVDRREQADKAEKESVKKGLQGTDAMVQAHQDVADAQKAEAKAEQDLADARRDAARSAQDSAQRIASAQQGVADAQASLAQAQAQGTTAMKAATTATDAYEAALAKLSPQQQIFVKRIIGLQDAWQNARKEIADPLFEGVNRALTTLLQGDLLGRVEDQLVTTSATIGDFVDSSAKLAESPEFQRPFLNVLENNNRNMGAWGDILQNLAVVFVKVANAARPLVTRFTNWADAVTTSWRESDKLDNKTGALRDTMKTAGDRVAEFWGLFKQLWRTLMLVGGAANDAANNFGDINRTAEDAQKKGYIASLTDSLKTFNDQLDTPGRKAAMIDRFTAALENLNSVGGAFKTAILDPLIAMGGDRRIGDGFDKIAQSDAFSRLAASANEAAPALGDLVVNVADLLAAISESGSMKTFLTAIGGVAGVLVDIVDKVPPGVLRAIGTALGIIAAVRFVGGIGQKALAALTPPGLDKIPGKIRGIGPKVEAAGATVKAAGQNIAVGFAISFTDGMAAAGTELVSAAKGGVRKIAQAAGLDEGTKIGVDLMKGIAVGIEEGSSGVYAAATGAGAAIVREMKAAMGVKSPSTLTAAAGVDVMRGVSLGIEEGLPAAEATAATAGRTVGTTVGTSLKESAAVSSAGLGTTMGTAVSAEVTTATKSPKLAGSLGGFTKVFSGAARGLGTAMRGLGGAMNFMMGPWGILITILLPILMPLLQKLNDKFKITDKIFAALKWTVGKLADAFSWLWEHVLSPMFDWITAHWRVLAVILFGPFGLAVVVITKYWNQIWDVIKIVFNWIRDHWKLLLGILTGPIGIAVLLITKNWDTIKAVVSAAVDFVKGVLGKIWDGILAGWNAIVTFFNGLWSNQLQPIFQNIIDKAKGVLSKIWNGIRQGWNAIGDFIRNLWVDRIKTPIDNLLTSVGTKLLNFFKGIIKGYAAIGRWLGNLWANEVWPKIHSLLDSATAKLTGFFQGIKDGWKDIKGWFDGLWGDISGKVDNFVKSFTGAISGIWLGLKKGLAWAWNWVAEKINSYVIGGINSVLDFFHAPNIPDSAKVDTMAVPTAMAVGGFVRGPGGPKDDKILTRLSNGEFVMPAWAARGIGPDALEYMRKHGTLPGEGGGIGGFFSGLLDKFKSGIDAAKHGGETAAKWIIGKAISKLEGGSGGVIANIAIGAFKNGIDALIKFLKDKEPAPAAGVGKVVGDAAYVVPPGTLTYNWSGHNPASALDIGVGDGTPVHAFASGVVDSVLTASGSGYGLYVTLKHGGGLFSRYAHLSGAAVSPGAKVKVGQVIAYSGHSGLVPAHLHLEVTTHPGAANYPDTHSRLVAAGIRYPYSSSGSSGPFSGGKRILRRGGRNILRLAGGGVIEPTSLGTLALLAEAGKSERVTPLDREGFTPAERRILEALDRQLSDGNGGGDTIHVHPAQQMDEAALADMVARRVAWKRRRGGGFR